MRTSRRAASGAILAAPLASGPVSACSATPPLSALVTRYARFAALLHDETVKLDAAKWRGWGNRHGKLCAICGALRRRICLHPVATMADVQLKVRAYAISQSYDEGREELLANMQERPGHAYLDDMALAIVVDMIGLGEGRPCA